MGLITKKVLDGLGMLPPPLKSEPVFRALSALARRLPRDAGPTVSNLGISPKLRCEFNSNVPLVYLFGRAEHYTGERGALFLARQLSAECDAFVDIGAHQGYFTFFVRNGLRAQTPVYFVEPEPSLYAQIEHNVAINRLPNVTGMRVGIGAQTGQASFYLAHDSLEGTLKPDAQGLSEIRIDVTTFDDFARAKKFSAACVKVDIENAEIEFLQGAVAERRRIRYLICEVLAKAVEQGFLVKAARELEMNVYYMNDFRLEPCIDGRFDYVPPQYNFFFCRESAEELSGLLSGTRFTVGRR